MASVHEYKQLEKSIIQKLKDSVVVAGHGAVKTLQAIGGFLTRRYTVVFVPHSEKRVYNFQITVMSVFLFMLVTGGAVGAFFWYSASGSTRNVFDSKDGRLKEVQASLEQLRDETELLLREARNFEAAFDGAFTGLSPHTPQSSSGDLGSFFNIRETPEGVLQEVDDIKRLSAYLASAAGPVRELGAMLSSQSALLSEIPSIWPVKGGMGHISMFFGQNENPFSGQQYIHKGIDISTYRAGDPVVTTADGQVVTIERVEDFGLYILVRHKHGYYTRYAHLLSSRVRVGDRVQQGDIIGYIGNTGISTGPHLHYEIHIGSDVVDPYRYITIRSSHAKPAR
jgi:murein DD-endopeptidase MepM/ murein hydrolase activator NlpD